MPDSAKVPAAPPRYDYPSAFPTALRPTVAALTASAAWQEGHYVAAHSVVLDGERLTIPTRVYFDAALLWKDDGRSDGERCIAWCVGTRHHDGYVRATCLRRLLAAPPAQILPYAVPFIVHLIGEYVVEIIQPIDAALAHAGPAATAAFGAFARANPRYLDTIERRVRSYWHVYYRHACPDLAGYPGTQALARLRAMALTQR